MWSISPSVHSLHNSLRRENVEMGVSLPKLTFQVHLNSISWQPLPNYLTKMRQFHRSKLAVTSPLTPFSLSLIGGIFQYCLALSQRSWRYYVGARLKFWRRSRVPKKGSRDETVEILDYITTAPPPNLTGLLHNTASYAGYLAL